ncbi:MAG TPA: alpha-amylase family glycosyl hydrolase [Verrucomicrobiae bacterium]|nr:alpha-amylase family glycosyl hydrolase [Verrucomicrobiae bacterium]
MDSPLLYEINTRCWLRDLSETRGTAVTLGDIPESQFAAWQEAGFTHIWLMGVWTGGPLSREKALHAAGLERAYSEALPDWTEQDVGPSPYSIAAYRVSQTLGGEPALVEFRRKLRGYGMKLILDFVPNHVGLDHPWITEQPELLVQSSSPVPDTFMVQTHAGTRFLAYGKDPNCGAWTDTVQLDYRKAETQAAMQAVLRNIAGLCDGVRCDMAMLVLADVFGSTWKAIPVAEPAPPTEFWSEAISGTRRFQPGFLFLAEVYWGLEARLQSLGFDYTYDKALYDSLIARSGPAVQRHLLEMPAPCVAGCAHFLENHDERRVASVLSDEEQRAAALVILGVPGMRFLHEGQLEGARRRLPVQLIRRAGEPVNQQVRESYTRILAALRQSSVGRGTPALLEPRRAWQDNPTAENFVLVQWTAPTKTFDIVVVNLAPHPAQCYAPVKPPAKTSLWSMKDLLGPQSFKRATDDLLTRGLYLDLPAHGAQIFHFEPAA